MIEKILKILAKNEDYISGEEIGKILNISRASVWKYMKKLKEIGYEIESISNRGYKLKNNIDFIDKESLKIENLFFEEEMASTNDYAKKIALENCPNWSVVLCNNQTNGRGRLGRSWEAEKNSGIYISFVLRPEILPQYVYQITLVVGVAIRRVLESLTGLEPLIKWPNDILINGKKVAGILTEMNSEMEKINFVIVGVGINVNNSKFSEDIAQKATSIMLETNKIYSRNEIIRKLVIELEKCYNQFCLYGFKPFKEEYNKYCANVGKNVTTQNGSEKTTGISKGVNEKGELIIESENGQVNVLAGEVSIRLSDGRYI